MASHEGVPADRSLLAAPNQPAAEKIAAANIRLQLTVSSQGAAGGGRGGRGVSSLAIMTVVGEYELIRKIGEGGYGKIFIARRVSGNGPSSEVVLKQVKLPTRKQDRDVPEGGVHHEGRPPSVHPGV